MDLKGTSAASRAEMSILFSRVPEIFTIKMAESALNESGSRLSHKLSKWVKAGYLVRIKRGTFIQIPLNIEDPRKWLGDGFVLANSLWPNCYFTGWTTANYWGLTEQVFRILVVRTTDRVRSELNENIQKIFWVKHSKHLDKSWGIVNEWRDGVKISLADAPRTLVEVLAEPEIGGGIRLVAEMVYSYLDDFDIKDLLKAADNLSVGTVYKRLGYLLELIKYENHSVLMDLEGKVTSGITLLDPAGTKNGTRAMKWNLQINAKIERSYS